MARIDLKSLAHSYFPEPKGDEDYALRRMEHVWEDGGAYALLGPSGCGKTTLLNIISGLLTPSEGQVLFDGKDVTKLAPEERNIAQVFQFPVIYDTMTVYENLAFPLRNRGVDPKRVDERVREIAGMLDLTGKLKQKARGLGADEKQTISLGRGLVRDDVSAILFDEPLTVIDPHLKWVLRRKLKEIHNKLRPTMVYVTHDQVEALTFADKVVVMYGGKVVQLGTPQELFENPAHTFVGYFIGSPGMNIMPCNIDAGAAWIDGKRIALSDRHMEAVSKASGQIELGIRPEFLRIETDSGSEGDNGIEVNIVKVEDLGQYKIATTRFGSSEMKVKVSEDQQITGQSGILRFAPEWTKLYADSQLVA
ncbi:ABC transporter ATP-binding protein [Thalassospira lucentensis]|jgi:glycerol transport system ATP-binding protein|uniref:ABC transporter ATP-binding protein n=3 Tax=Thalassospira TaxID=168934 RepID=A0A154L6X2_9PROT|nr:MULTISPECIES: ABC transporter ATP-binding protein [Thalassospira]KZB66136.1 ABC transporter ATP-binding protein [Thalassospira lucentensis]MCH2277145.1 ABC transporter ATP-binding protein [Thalassospira sp.]RCK04945.1 ABC transporter ATP-binding protein [Thalassospira xianhensis MCCC 1A02616]WOI11162.1 ABC transporter ATP-binding protein [Thalassospira lucentensis]SOC30694.1 carbohydrate ABC transporter ATP-binding protein, CUT1 family [Thalassospira xiamenensis]